MTSYDSVKDSGERRDFGTGSVRDVADGKGRYDLLPPMAIKRLAVHYENGAKKYGDNNWKLGQPLGTYLDSGLRHAFNVLELQVDEDHPAAAIWNMVSFMWTVEEIRASRLPRELDNIGYIDALEAAEREREVDNTPVWVPSSISFGGDAYASAEPAPTPDVSPYDGNHPSAENLRAAALDLQPDEACGNPTCCPPREAPKSPPLMAPRGPDNPCAEPAPTPDVSYFG